MGKEITIESVGNVPNLSDRVAPIKLKFSSVGNLYREFIKNTSALVDLAIEKTASGFKIYNFTTSGDFSSADEVYTSELPIGSQVRYNYKDRSGNYVQDNGSNMLAGIDSFIDYAENNLAVGYIVVVSQTDAKIATYDGTNSVNINAHTYELVATATAEGTAVWE